MYDVIKGNGVISGSKVVGYGYVNDCGGLYTQSDVGNKRLSKIEAKLVKCKLKQRKHNRTR